MWRQHWPRLSSPVRSLEVAAGILSFGLVEAGARVVILDTVFISERLRGEFFRFVPMRCRFVGGGFVGWGRWGIRSWGTVRDGDGDGGSHDGRENDGLKNAI